MSKILIGLMILTFLALQTNAQTANAGEQLDLGVVGELFKDSENLEKFEQSLNDAANGVNNLDLDADGAVDFIRVSERTAGDAHLIVLQAATGENDFQDVATIAVERENADYGLQIQGDEELYGANYYIVPAERNFGAWNIIKRIFSPNYRVYVSPYRWRYYPKYFTVRRPVAVNVYRTRINTLAGRRNFVVSKTTTVRSVSKFNYRPSRSSVIVKKRTTTTTVTNQRNGAQRVKQTTTVTKTRKGRKN